MVKDPEKEFGKLLQEYYSKEALSTLKHNMRLAFGTEPCKICKGARCAAPYVNQKCSGCESVEAHIWERPNPEDWEGKTYQWYCLRCARERGLLW